MNALSTKLQNALNAVNAGAGNHVYLADTLGCTRNAACARANRLAKAGLLRSVSMGMGCGPMLMATEAGLALSVADLDEKRDGARSAYVAARKNGRGGAEAAELSRLSVMLDAVENMTV